MKLTIIGCTGSFPGPGSPASCYLVSAFDGERQWKILLDLGSGALGVLQRYTDIKDLDAIFISHLHPDHCMDLCGMHVAIRWDPAGWGRERMLVHGPAATADRMATAYGLPLEEGMHPDYDFQNWKAHEPVKIGPFSITPYPVLHPIEESYALRVEATEPMADGTMRTSVLTYSGDTDSCPGLIEAAPGRRHVPLRGRLRGGPRRRHQGRAPDRPARRPGRDGAGVERLLLTHIPVWTDINTVVNEAKEVFGGIAVAVSGVTYGVWGVSVFSFLRFPAAGSGDVRACGTGCGALA